jgi:hypothetical protein
MNRPLNLNTVELLAQLAHEINRAYCAGLGDTSQTAWTGFHDDAEHSPAELAAMTARNESARAGVRAVLNGEASSPEEQHDLWMRTKLEEGWRHGERKDEIAKTHPCLVPYEQLPPEQRVKDHLFRAAVLHGLNMLCDYATISKEQREP